MTVELCFNYKIGFLIMDKYELAMKAIDEVQYRYIEAAKRTGLLSKEELETLTKKELFMLAMNRIYPPTDNNK